MILYLSTVMALERRDTLINDGNVCMNMYVYCYNLLGVSLHVVLLPPFFFLSVSNNLRTFPSPVGFQFSR